MDRRTGIEMMNKFDLKNSVVAVCADKDTSEISNYVRGVKVSSATETIINRTIQDIVRVIERAAPLRPDVGNGPYLKSLIRAWREGAVYAVLVQTRPARYFIHQKNNQVMTTAFFLQSACVTESVAGAIAETLRNDGFTEATVLENPYANVDQRYPIETGDPKQTEEFKALMGT
jgi:hypothetical protein